MKADPSGSGYIVKHRMGNYYRRGQYGRDEMTEHRGQATVFTNYETAAEIAVRINGIVIRSTQQLALL